MMKFYAEHVGGQSVSHPCKHGIYSDPADWWEYKSSEDEDKAMVDALLDFEKTVNECVPCNCDRNLCPGGKSWWDSIIIVHDDRCYKCAYDLCDQVVESPGDICDREHCE